MQKEHIKNCRKLKQSLSMQVNSGSLTRVIIRQKTNESLNAQTIQLVYFIRILLQMALSHK